MAVKVLRPVVDRVVDRTTHISGKGAPTTNFPTP